MKLLNALLLKTQGLTSEKRTQFSSNNYIAKLLKENLKSSLNRPSWSERIRMIKDRGNQVIVRSQFNIYGSRGKSVKPFITTMYHGTLLL